jgi:pimeloyl-ACP methyl ester carboxylesterase
MPFASVNGVELYYETEGQGPTLVFCHGADGNHMSWWQQVPAFCDRYLCVVFDHRGFGRSHAEEGQGGDGYYVADMHALLEHLGVDQVILVGQSMGNRSGLGYALAHPERVRAVAVCDGIGSFSEAAIDARLAESRATRETGPEFIGLLAPDYPVREPAKLLLYRQIARLNPKRPAGPSQEKIGVNDLRGLHAPALFIAGEYDHLTPPDVLQQLAELVPRGRFQMIANAGHSAHFERPDEFNGVLSEFLSEVAAG